ncbi:MAG: poly(beta-D-mannuronate) lyase, partial [Verrucomicrobiota bacterium]
MNESDSQKLRRRNHRSGAWAALLAGWLLLGISARAAEISVNNASEVTIAAAQSHPGDTIVMRDGIWQNADLLFAANGALGNPVTLRAQTLGGVQLTGSSRLRIAGSFLVVDGLIFTNGFRTSGEVIAFQDTISTVANFSRLTNCVIVDYNPPDTTLDVKWVSMFGFSNRVENCFFKGKSNLGTTLIVWVDAAPDKPNYHVIRHNYFGPRPAYPANGAETIRVGTSEVSMNLSRTTVEENYFEQCNGDAEIISSKSCENIYRHNTFVDCEGALSLRHGNRCVVEGNYFFGHLKTLTGGVRIVGEDHKVYNNYFADLAGTSSRAPMAIMQGLDPVLYGGPLPLNGYFQVQRAVVAHNTFVNCANPLVIGLVGTLTGSTNITTLPPVDCVIANNLALSSSGKLVDQRTTPVNLAWEGNILFGTTLGITPIPGITVTNPALVFGTDGLWRPDTASPARGGAQGNYPYITI